MKVCKLEIKNRIIIEFKRINNIITFQNLKIIIIKKENNG